MATKALWYDHLSMAMIVVLRNPPQVKRDLGWLQSVGRMGSVGTTASLGEHLLLPTFFFKPGIFIFYDKVQIEILS